MSWLLRMLSGAVLVLSMADAWAGDDSAIVRIRSRAYGFVTNQGVVVRGYCFLPRGFLPASRGSAYLETPSGWSCPTECDPVAYHSDGSVRAATLCVLVPRPHYRAGVELRLRKGASVPIAGGLKADSLSAGEGKSDDVKTHEHELTIRVPGGVLVDRGSVRIALQPGLDMMPALTASDMEIRDSRPCTVRVNHASGVLSSHMTGARVVRRGVLSTRVSAVGAVEDSEGMCALTARVDLTAVEGSAVIDGTIVVRSIGGAGLVSDPSWDLPLGLAAPYRVELLGGSGRRISGPRKRVSVASSPYSRVWGHSGSMSVPMDSGSRNGLLIIGSRGRAVAMVASRLGPNAPRAVEFHPDGRLRFVLHSGPLFLEPGVACRADFALAVGTYSDIQRNRTVLLQEPLPGLESVDREGKQASPLEGMTLLGGGGLGIPLDPTARLLARVDEAITSVTGYRNYGDYRLGSGFANLEYDPAAAFLLRGLAVGDARTLILARDMLDHWVTYDCSQGEGNSPVAFPWMHGREHRSLRWELGHAWADGLVLGTMTFGEPRYIRLAQQLQDTYADLVEQVWRINHEREFGWALLAMNSLLQLSQNDRLDEAQTLLRNKFMGRQNRKGFFEIDRPPEHVEGDFGPRPWVSGGISMEALYRQWACSSKSEREGLYRSMDRLADFLMTDALLEGGNFASVVVYERATGALLGKQEGADPVDTLMIAAGLGRAAVLRLHPNAMTLFKDVLTRSLSELRQMRLSANDACRALVAVRSIADSLRLIRERS